MTKINRIKYNVIKFDVFDSAVSDILKAIDGNSLMGSMILLFCCIDYMGMALDPEKEENKSIDFKRYLNDYMGEINPKYKDKEIQNALWIVRISIVHVYGSSKASKEKNVYFNFESNNPKVRYLHLTFETNLQSERGIIIFLPSIVGELVASIELFFRKNIDNIEKLYNWRLKLLSITDEGNTMLRDMSSRSNTSFHRFSHPFLEVLDRIPPVEIKYISTEIENYVYQRINKKLLKR